MSYHREKVVLPRVGPIRWRKDGYGTQVLTFSAGGECLALPTGGEVVPSGKPLQRGYVKVWWQGPVERIVVDRALTVRVARRRIAHIKARGGPLFAT